MRSIRHVPCEGGCGCGVRQPSRMQRATRNVQHSTCNTQRATRHVQRATRNTQHATCNGRHAVRSTPNNAGATKNVAAGHTQHRLRNALKPCDSHGCVDVAAWKYRMSTIARAEWMRCCSTPAHPCTRAHPVDHAHPHATAPTKLGSTQSRPHRLRARPRAGGRARQCARVRLVGTREAVGRERGRVRPAAARLPLHSVGRLDAQTLRCTGVLVAAGRRRVRC